MIHHTRDRSHLKTVFFFLSLTLFFFSSHLLSSFSARHHLRDTVYISALKTCTMLKHKQGLWLDLACVFMPYVGAKLTQGCCRFASWVGNAVWHTVDSTVRETHHRWREGKWDSLNKLSATDPRLRIYGIRILLIFVYTVCFANTLTKPPTSGYEVEVVKHTLATTLAKFTLQWERRGAFTSLCYLNSFMFGVIEKVYFAYSNMDLMKLAHTGLRECMQCRFVWTLCLCMWWGWGQKCLRVRAKAHWTAGMCFCTTLFVLLERE